MKIKEKIVLILLILALGSPYNHLLSQNQVKPSRQSSMEAFSKGNYELAYTQFRELLQIYPKDPLYKYYAAVCLVKMNRDAKTANDLLSQSLGNAAAVKSLPADAMFYLGRARQMKGDYRSAEEAYESFTKEAGKKTAKELGVPDFILQSREGKGKIEESENLIASSAKTRSTPVKIEQEVQLPPAPRQELPPDIDKVMDEGLSLQRKADSLSAVAELQRKQSENQSTADKKAARDKIAVNEAYADSIQKAADKKYTDAEQLINPQVEKAKNDVVQVPKKDSIKISDVVSKEKKEDKTVVIEMPVKQEVIKGKDIFSVFEVQAKPATSEEKVQINPDVPEGLIYRIQIAVFRNPVALSYFKGLSPIHGFKLEGTENTIYYAGMFRRSTDAAKAVTAVRAKGFKDAFVVALSGKKPVSSDRAAVLEKEWGNKPLMSIPDIQAGSVTEIDTVPPALAFRVEVARSQKPLKDDVLEGMRKIAGRRGLDIKNLADGNTAYLIGNFITFESAADYANLLTKNGYRDARVVAWLGRKEIPVDTAKQLFESLK